MDRAQTAPGVDKPETAPGVDWGETAPARSDLIVAANRGPVSFHSDPSGEPVVTRGAGGLVTVLSAMLLRHPGVWIAAAATAEEE